MAKSQKLGDILFKCPNGLILIKPKIMRHGHKHYRKHTCDEWFRNGASSAAVNRLSFVTRFGYKLVNIDILDCPPYNWAPAKKIRVPRLKPNAASIKTASSGIKGQCPRSLLNIADSNLLYKMHFESSIQNSNWSWNTNLLRTLQPKKECEDNKSHSLDQS